MARTLPLYRSPRKRLAAPSQARPDGPSNEALLPVASDEPATPPALPAKSAAAPVAVDTAATRLLPQHATYSVPLLS